MPFEFSAAGLFWLLLPIAAASGWYAARAGRSGAPLRSGNLADLSNDYFRGLNFLINEQPDKAIEVFVNLLEVDTDTVETHLALGNLFRRRGEVDRAIRIHQNLVARDQLDRDLRGLALLELGVDYMRSGLLDRAESVFQELLQLGVNSQPALRYLIQIYQQEQDWEKALESASTLELQSGERLGSMMAHFYCERADLARKRGDFERALSLIRQALGVDANCVRASLMEGEIAATRGDDESAVRAYERVASQDREYLAEAIYPLLASQRRLGKLEKFKAYLEKTAGTHCGITPVLVLAELAAESGDLNQAMQRISEELRRRPSIRGLKRLTEYALASSTDSSREHLELLQEFTSKLLENRDIYRCGECGFTGKSLHWQCPGCKAWNTVKPIHGIEGE